MRIILSPTDFTNVLTSYYSPPFRQGVSDTLMAVQAELTETGQVTLQASIDEIAWSDVTDSTFDCDSTAIQIYSGGHPDLFYRLKTTADVVSVNILV